MTMTKALIWIGGATLAIDVDWTSWVGCTQAPEIRMVWRPYSS